MTLVLNLISPAGAGASPGALGQTNETSADSSNETEVSGSSAAAEQSSGASQTSEAKPSETVKPVNTDVAVATTSKTDIESGAEPSEASDLAARKFASKARAETIVAALIEAISAPIQASEMAAVEAAEAELEAGQARQSVAEQNDQSESGVSALRADS